MSGEPLGSYALEVAVPLCWCALGHLARHRGRAWRDDHGRFGMALGDAGVDAILVVRAIGGEGRHRARGAVAWTLGWRCRSG